MLVADVAGATLIFVVPKIVFVPVAFPMLVADVAGATLIFVVPRIVFVEPVNSNTPVVFPIYVAAVPDVLISVVPMRVI